MDNQRQVDGHAESQVVVAIPQPSERRIEPLSDEWFDDLDKSIDEITRLFEEMRVAPPEPEDATYIQQAEDGLAAMEQDLTHCFSSLETLKRRLGNSGRRKGTTSSDISDDDLYRPFRPRSLDLGALQRVKKTKYRVDHRKSMSSVSSSHGEAALKHFFRC